MAEKKQGIFTKIKNFFKRSFKDMGESAKAQHEVDKANFEAAKAESRANFEENRFTNTYSRAKEQARESWEAAKMSPAERTAKTREEQQRQIEEANARKAAAEDRIQEAQKSRM